MYYWIRTRLPVVLLFLTVFACMKMINIKSTFYSSANYFSLKKPLMWSYVYFKKIEWPQPQIEFVVDLEASTEGDMSSMPKLFALVLGPFTSMITWYQGTSNNNPIVTVLKHGRPHKGVDSVVQVRLFPSDALDGFPPTAALQVLKEKIQEVKFFTTESEIEPIEVSGLPAATMKIKYKVPNEYGKRNSVS